MISKKKTVIIHAAEADRILFNLCDILELLSPDSNAYHVIKEATELLEHALLKEQS